MEQHKDSRRVYTASRTILFETYINRIEIFTDAAPNQRGVLAILIKLVGMPFAGLQ